MSRDDRRVRASSGTLNPVMSAVTDTENAAAPDDVFRIALVCLGNICRSPMAATVLHDKLDRAALADRVVVESGGLGSWHLGEPADIRARQVLRRHGYDADAHRARQVDAAWFDRVDLMLAMDRQNLAELLALAPDESSWNAVQMFRTYDPGADDYNLDIPDPYYGDEADFEHAIALIQDTSDGLVRTIEAELTDGDDHGENSAAAS